MHLKGVFKKAVSMLLCVSLCAGLCVTAMADNDGIATIASNSSVQYNVTYQQDKARESLQYVNAFRTSDTWYWNSDNTTKTYVSGLNALTYDYDLEPAAMQRAAEIAIYFSHTRPNNSSWFTVLSEDGCIYGYTTAGENLAAGSAGYCDTAQKTITLLEEETELYAGQGHRRNMLGTNYTTYAMGCVYVNNTYYWAMMLAKPSGSTNTTNPTTVNTSSTVATVNINSDIIELSSSTFEDMAIETGKTVNLPSLNLTIKPSFVASSSSMALVNMGSTGTWSSSNTNAVTINNSNGTITGVGEGTSTITYSISGFSVSFKVTVEAKVSPVYYPAVASTCSTHGHIAYWYLEETVKYYADEAMTQEITFESTILPLDNSNHSYNRISDKDATCTEEGFETFVCTECGDTYTTQERPLGHNYVMTRTEPTCTEDGSIVYTCSRCQKSYTENISALGHNWSEWEVNPNNSNEKTRSCNNCGVLEEEYIEIPEHNCADHYFGEYFVWSEDGCTLILACSICDEEYSFNASNISNNVVQPSCTEDGYTEHTATFDINGTVYTHTYNTDLIEATGHVWNETGRGDATCHSHAYVENTCSVCGMTETVVTSEEFNHNWSYVNNYDWNITNDGTVTCTATIHCADCDAIDTVDCEVEEDEVIGVQTCGEEQTILWVATAIYNGVEYGSDTYTQVLLPTGNHVWGSWEVITEPTCEENGESERICEVCNAVETQVLPAIGHNYEVEFIWNSAKTSCVARFVCQNCGDVVVEDCTIRRITTPATCTTDGYVEEIASCTFDNKEYTDSLGIVETIPAIGHNYGGTPTFHWINDTECEAYFYCQNGCGSYITRECTISLVNTNATCTTAGFIIYTATVSFDGQSYTNPDVKYVEEAPLGHHYEKYAVIEPTCTEEGYTVYRCTRCDDEYTADYVEALGHEWNDGVVVKEATATEDGEIVYTCLRCGAIRTEIILATGSGTTEGGNTGNQGGTTSGNEGGTTSGNNGGSTSGNGGSDSGTTTCDHNWELVSTIKEPTCTQAGEGLYRCTKCGEEETREIPALGHKPMEVQYCTFIWYDKDGDMYSSSNSYFDWDSNVTCQLIIPCERCGTTETLNCKVSVERESYATCETTGNMNYIASYSGELWGYEIQSYTNEKTVAQDPATGHSYSVNATSYVWTDRNGVTWQYKENESPSSDFIWDENVTCVAYVTCSVCGKTTTVDCKVTMEDSYKNGVAYTVFTATIPDTEFYCSVETLNNEVTGIYATSGEISDEAVGDTSAEEANKALGTVLSERTSGSLRNLNLNGGDETGSTSGGRTGDNVLVLIACGFAVIGACVVGTVAVTAKKKEKVHR